MNQRAKNWLTSGICLSLAFALAFNNPMIVDAATKVVVKYAKTILSPKDVGSDIYLKGVFKLKENTPYVGTFISPEDYQFYYGTSKDLVNWDLQSRYFSLINGNGIFVGLSSDEEYNKSLNFTKDGSNWQTATLPKNFNPTSVKFENGYFKLYGYNNTTRSYELLLSKDANTWFNVSKDLPKGTKVQHVLVKNNKFYAMTGTSQGGKSFIFSSASTINEKATKWTASTKLSKTGYGFRNEYYFDGTTVGVKLYSIAEFTKNKGVANNLYYISKDFVNWEKKDWTQTNYGSYYSLYANTSTDAFKPVMIKSTELEALENVVVKGKTVANADGEIESEQPDIVSSFIVRSTDGGKNFTRDFVTIKANGTQVNTLASADAKLTLPAELESLRSGFEFMVNRNTIYFSDPLQVANEETYKGGLVLRVMEVLKLKPAAPLPKTFKVFSDFDTTSQFGAKLNEAKFMGLITADESNNSNAFSSITLVTAEGIVKKALVAYGLSETDATAKARQCFTIPPLPNGLGKNPDGMMTYADQAYVIGQLLELQK